jgi:hypothetical protein
MSAVGGSQPGEQLKRMFLPDGRVDIQSRNQRRPGRLGMPPTRRSLPTPQGHQHLSSLLVCIVSTLAPSETRFLLKVCERY